MMFSSLKSIFPSNNLSFFTGKVKDIFSLMTFRLDDFFKIDRR